MGYTRRRCLRAGAVVIAGALTAGCAGRGGAEGTPGQASLFPLADWANAVGDGHLTFETPVPAGRAGHGWEPRFDDATVVADADVFVYLDSPAFAWARTAADDLEANGAVTVDAQADVDLLAAEHDHGDHAASTPEEADPHVWTDPVRAMTMVDTIRDGLIAYDPANESAYRDNAAAYRDRLQDLHDSIEAALAERSRDVVILAAHDSYTYLADRYGLRVHAPQGVSPDDTPSTGDIGATLDLIETHDIDVVLTDVFGADDLAETLVADSSATEIREISPLEGTTDAWEDDRWGYVEQMEQVNLPALQAALGAS